MEQHYAAMNSGSPWVPYFRNAHKVRLIDNRCLHGLPGPAGPAACRAGRSTRKGFTVGLRQVWGWNILVRNVGRATHILLRDEEGRIRSQLRGGCGLYLSGPKANTNVYIKVQHCC